MSIVTQEIDDSKSGLSLQRFRTIGADGAKDEWEWSYGDSRGIVQMPPEYDLRETGVYKRRNGGWLRITTAPLVIVSRLIDEDNGSQFVRLGWVSGNTASMFDAGRAEAFHASELVKLARYGVPVNSKMAGEVTFYLDAFEAVNYDSLPCERLSHRFGWHNGGFLLGRTFIAEAGARPLAFKGQSPDDEQLADSVTQSGTLAGWLDAVQLASSYPSALYGSYAAFTAPLLDILGCSGFVMDYSGRTTIGKTTVLRLAASAYANPDEKQATAVKTWDVTAVWAERTAGVLSGLPLILDDTRMAVPERVARIVYEVSSGQGRGRGSLEGRARTARWHTVLLSSGEQRATSFSKQGGVHARVLTLASPPFGTSKVADVARPINALVFANYGHAMPLFLRWVIGHHDEWMEWRREYQRMWKGYITSESGDVADRLSASHAAIVLTSRLLHRALTDSGVTVTWDAEAALDGLWQSLASETIDATGEWQAAQDVLAWASTYDKHFVRPSKWGKNGHGQPEEDGAEVHVPPGEVYGEWDKAGNLRLFRPQLSAFLTAQGYNPEETLAHWRERGWSDCDLRHRDKLVHHLGRKVRMVVLVVTKIPDEC